MARIHTGQISVDERPSFPQANPPAHWRMTELARRSASVYFDPIRGVYSPTGNRQLSTRLLAEVTRPIQP